MDNLVKFVAVFIFLGVFFPGGDSQEEAITPETEDRNATLELESQLSNGNGTHLPCSTLEVGGPVTRKNGVIDERFRWREFRVFVDPGFNQQEHRLVNNALYRLHTALPGCVNFTIFPHGSQNPPSSGDYIYVQNGNGCSSHVGKQGNRQIVTLQNPGCMFVGTIVHEMVHALGFFHEQSRPDRDDHVTIMWDNVEPRNRHNFNRADGTSTFDVAYNLRSIMHYGARDFSHNGQPTIVARNGGEVGSTGEIEQTDIDKLKRMYSC